MRDKHHIFLEMCCALGTAIGCLQFSCTTGFFKDFPTPQERVAAAILFEQFKLLIGISSLLCIVDVSADTVSNCVHSCSVETRKLPSFLPRLCGESCMTLKLRQPMCNFCCEAPTELYTPLMILFMASFSGEQSGASSWMRFISSPRASNNSELEPFF